MKRRSTDELIDALAVDAAPVTPLAPPLIRALRWLAFAAAGGLVAILGFGRLDPAARGLSPVWLAVEIGSAMLTGIIAVVAAFHLAIPGRSRRWALAPAPPLTIWLSVSTLGCWRDWVRVDSGGWALGHSADCLVFIVATSAVLGLPLLWVLSRARPLEPARAGLLGGLGLAALSAALLTFFHPFAVTFPDLAVHVLAAACVAAVSMLVSGRAMTEA